MTPDNFNAWVDHNTRLVEAEAARRLWTAIAWVLAAIAGGILAAIIVKSALARAIADAATLPATLMF